MYNFVVFNKDLSFTDTNTLVFKKGKPYLVLSEDKDYIYVQSKMRTNECSKIPKYEEGNLFTFINKRKFVGKGRE